MCRDYKGGDLIIAVDGHRSGLSELMSYMVVNRARRDVTFTLLRDGRTLDIDVVLGFRSKGLLNQRGASVL